jgi:hypothetical protein
MIIIFLAMASTNTTTGFTFREEDIAAFFISRNPRVCCASCPFEVRKLIQDF